MAAPSGLDAPAGTGQLAQTVRAESRTRLRASACAAAPCATGADSVVVDAPDEVSGEPVLERLDLGRGRSVVHARWGTGPTYHVLFAAPLTGSSAPVVVHQGWANRPEGMEGERRVAKVEVLGAPGGVRQIVLGEQREDMKLCGRPALLSARVLDARSLELKPALYQRLGAREREAATRLTATPALEPGAGALLLNAQLASSAVGKPRAASDGDLETTWAEGRGRGGTGEFITFRAPADVEIIGFELVARPPSGGSPQASGPKQFWLATDRELFDVTLPEDSWATPGARYRVELTKPIRTQCVAFVLGEPSSAPGASTDVTLAELVALPSGGELDADALIAALDGPEPEARRAVALLAARRDSASHVASAFAQATPLARSRLLDVLDQLPCAEAASTYALAVEQDDEELQKRGARGFERCSAEAGEALASALAKVDEGPAAAAREARLAEAIALFAPARAVSVLTPRLAQPNTVRRKNSRVALAQATRSPSAVSAVKSALSDSSLSPRATVDLLRSLGERAAELPEASTALARLLESKPDWDTRYLLLRPAAYLSGDARARKFVESAITSDASPLVRSAAAEIVGEVSKGAPRPEITRALTKALGDENVRVRSAAARSLGGLRVEQASPHLQEVLEEDAWPLVRVSAAEALGAFAPSAKLDEALAEALEDDDSAVVRASAARALGSRGALAHAELLRDALDDEEEAPEVRREAALALGALCDQAALSLLTAQAERLADPMLDTGPRSVASAATRALGKLRPQDLEARLSPLLRKQSPPPARAVARSVLEEAKESPGPCRRGR